MNNLIQKQIIINILLAAICVALIGGMLLQQSMIRQLREDNELALKSINILQKAVIKLTE